MTSSLAKYAEVEPEILPALQENAGAAISFPAVVGEQTSRQLTRMFRDPRVLEASERTELVAALREAVALAPQVTEVKVLLGMALSVDLQVQESLETLRAAARQAPDSFIAQLKFGELLMRLRICRQAEEVTHKAAKLAANAAQSDLARRQAATIRVMLREGVERGGYHGLFGKAAKLFRSAFHRNHETALAAAE
jgi:tetratricopeptide (TPR) repeat protein